MAPGEILEKDLDEARESILGIADSLRNSNARETNFSDEEINTAQMTSCNVQQIRHPASGFLPMSRPERGEKAKKNSQRYGT